MRTGIFFLCVLLTPVMVQASLISDNLSAASNRSVAVPIQKEWQRHLSGASVYIQIFKEEGTLELYTKLGDKYRLLTSYPICKFSGGLGPKRLSGDLKSPEGFYAIEKKNLNPKSQFHKSMDIGFPNSYDRTHGYTGSYLMIHGACVSVGCYAMTDNSIDEIYHYVRNALDAGQQQVSVNIYPFRMTSANMQRHKYSRHMDFWRQLKPAYDYFAANQQPPTVAVRDGRYVVMAQPGGKTSLVQLWDDNHQVQQAAADTQQAFIGSNRTLTEVK